MNELEVPTTWEVMPGDARFYGITKTIHNTLHGWPGSLSEDDHAYFHEVNRRAAQTLALDGDLVLIHDPQPVGLVHHRRRPGQHWVWRCHIDLSTPNREVLDFLLPAIRGYDAAIFHMAEYVPGGTELPPVVIQPPAIDPLAPKNMALAEQDAAFIVDQFGVDPARPLLLQVSRFDPWKDPLGVIDAYRLVKEEVAGVQLALVGSMAHDDPEGMEYWDQTVAYADGDPDIFILSNLNNVGSVEINAFQVHSAAVIQKSIKEGFGLTVSEALWKSRPTVAGNVGGIVTQIENGRTGWLVDSSEECAAACLEVLADPAAARELALAGKEHVRKKFLTPRLLRDRLALFNRLVGRATATELEVIAA
jgi:trehalose synthase